MPAEVRSLHHPPFYYWKVTGIDEDTLSKRAAGKTVVGAIPTLSAIFDGSIG
jgi:hypothetical protein